nr:Sir2 family NAD+-dependent deacetylase [uncultured Holophaga sp.]
MNTSAPSLVILTGAGISAESGLRTFRASDGLWEEHRVEDVATPEGFERDPGLVQRFYNDRRRQLREVTPNAAHEALAELERHWQGDFLLVTQNVDDLHDRAGNRKLLHMHGELYKVRCQRCRGVFHWEQDLHPVAACPSCGSLGEMRPHIVWFGEMPLHMERIGEALSTCDLFMAIGTSGNVYPAAGFVGMVPSRARRIEVNLEPSQVSRAFPEHRTGPATQTVPALVQELLGR